MNISIEDFTQSEFDDYMSYAIDNYAAANIKSGRWPEEIAKTESKKQYDYVLKDGLQSEGHVFWKVCFIEIRKTLTMYMYMILSLKKNIKIKGSGHILFQLLKNDLKL